MSFICECDFRTLKCRCPNNGGNFATLEKFHEPMSQHRYQCRNIEKPFFSSIILLVFSFYSFLHIPFMLVNTNLTRLSISIQAWTITLNSLRNAIQNSVNILYIEATMQFLNQKNHTPPNINMCIILKEQVREMNSHLW